MKKNLHKRIPALALALLLALTMGLGTVGVTRTSAAQGHTHGTAIGTLDELKSLYASGGTGYLTADLSYDEELTISSGKEVTLCFNGHLLIQSKHTVVKGSLTLEECNTTTKHYFTEGEHGIWYYNGDSAVTDYYITGGGITTAGDVTIEFDNYGGGAILVDQYGSLNLHGGNLVGNRSSLAGGAVYTKCYTEMFMDGGLIAHNGAMSYSGGGVYEEYTTFTMVGGEICGNWAGSYGGGIYLYDMYTRSFLLLGGSARVVENHEGAERDLDNLSNVYTHGRGINLSDTYPATEEMKIGVTADKDYFYDSSPYDAVIKYEGNDYSAPLDGARAVTEADLAYFTADSPMCRLVYDETEGKIVEECTVKITGTPEASNDYAFLTESEIGDYEDNLSYKWYEYEPVHELATTRYFYLPYIDGGTFVNGVLTSYDVANAYDGKYYAVFQFWSRDNVDKIYLTFENGLPEGLDYRYGAVSDDYENTICLTTAGYEYWVGADAPFTCKVYVDLEEPSLAEDQTGSMLMDAKSGDKFYGVLYNKDFGVAYPHSSGLYFTLEQDSLKSVKLNVAARSVYDSNTSTAYVLPENTYGNFKIYYRVNGAWTTTAPTAVGTYDVKVTRDRDTVHASYFKIIKDGLTIKATPVTGVSLDKTAAELTVGESLALTATVAPTTATDRSITYSSSDTAVATVNASGKVTAVKAGQAVITVTTTDGSFTATCTVTVKAAPGTGDQDTGNLEDITEKQDNAVSVSLQNDNLDELLSLTQEEQESEVKVWLEVKDAGDSVSTEDKTKIAEAVSALTTASKATTSGSETVTKNEYTVGRYLDVSLFKQVGNDTAEKVTTTNGKLKISLLVPEDLRKSGRKFVIVRVHKGTATVLEGTYDEKNYTFTFETDRFSSYAIAYQDITDTKTGDENGRHLAVWTLVGILSLIGGIGLAICPKMCENNANCGVKSRMK